jgi:hypothetical protein
MAKNFELVPLPNLPEVKQEKPTQVIQSPVPVTATRMHVDVPYELAEQVKDHVYWKRSTQQELLLQAVKEFLDRNTIESRPESEKTKNKAGRKRKNNL